MLKNISLLIILYFFAINGYAGGMSLDEIIDYALEESFDVKIAKSRLNQYESLARQADSQLFPRLSLSYSLSHYGNHPTLPYTRTNTYALEANQVLFSGGSISSGRRAATNTVFAKEHELNFVKTKLIYNLKTAYYSAIFYRETEDVLIRQRDILKRHLDVLKERFRAGEASSLDYLRAES